MVKGQGHIPKFEGTGTRDKNYSQKQDCVDILCCGSIIISHGKLSKNLVD